MKNRRPESRGEPLIRRSHRSQSPLMNHKREQWSQMRFHGSSDRRSRSRERRKDHSLRRFDHGKELVHGHSQMHSPSSSREDGFRFHHNYLLQEHASSNPSWKSSQAVDDGGFRFHVNEALPRFSLDVEDDGLLGQKPRYVGEMSSRSFLSGHPMGSSVTNSDRMKSSGSSFGIGFDEVEMRCFNDGIRDPYDDFDRRRIYSKDLSSSQMRTFNGISSSGVLKEEFKGLHRSPISDGLGTGINRYRNAPLEQYAYNQVPKINPLKHGLIDESRIYDYDELQQSGLDDRRRRVQDELYDKMHWSCHTELRNASSSTILDYPGDWMDKDDAADRNLVQRKMSEYQHYLDGEVVHDYDDVRVRQEVLSNSGNWHGGLKTESSKDHERIPFGESFVSEKVLFPISHRAEHRNSKSLISNHGFEEHKLSMGAHNLSHADGLGDYDSEWIENKNYGIMGDRDGNDSRVVFMNDRQSFAPYRSEEMWSTREPVESLSSKSRLIKHSRNIKFSRGISKSNVFTSSMHAKRKFNVNVKWRLKHNRSDFNTPNFSERGKDLLRSCKYGKRGRQDRLGAQGRGTHDSGAHVVKNDPPEDSEEFKQQVHKAFLRFSKLLNESQHNQRIYKTEGNAYSLLCSVCGSTSKEFVDTNSLVAHSYHSNKAGFKTEHLGFHKALCVLLGWNCRIPPDNSRAYQYMPVAEAKAIRDDLILWPPLVIIHNISIGDNSTNDATVESLEKMLRDMGFGAAKIRVCLGNPADRSTFTVKFNSTFSGFHAAERLHKYFADKKRGKEEFRQIPVPIKSREEKSQSKQVDEFLYGYIAVAEDLDKVDPETKRRALLKSKKDDIEAIADAPLYTD